MAQGFQIEVDSRAFLPDFTRINRQNHDNPIHQSVNASLRGCTGEAIDNGSQPKASPQELPSLWPDSR